MAGAVEGSVSDTDYNRQTREELNDIESPQNKREREFKMRETSQTS